MWSVLAKIEIKNTVHLGLLLLLVTANGVVTERGFERVQRKNSEATQETRDATNSEKKKRRECGHLDFSRVNIRLRYVRSEFR